MVTALGPWEVPPCRKPFSSLSRRVASSVDYFDDLTPGLSLRVTANDVRTWTVFYRDVHSRQKRLTLGRYLPKLNKKSWEEDERQIEADLLPKWKARPASEIREPVAANRPRALVSRIFMFAAEQRLVPATANPVIGVKKPTKEMSRDRVLTDDEIRRIWDAGDTQNPYVSALFRLRLVTVQRGGELLQMRWQDVDEQSHFWSIPAEFVKNAPGHRVYLNDLARKVLATVQRDEKSVWVFPKSFMGD